MFQPSSNPRTATNHGAQPADQPRPAGLCRIDALPPAARRRVRPCRRSGGTGLGQLPFFQVAESKLYDLAMRWTVDPAHADPAISVVEIDEISLRRLEPVVGRWPWPRLVHAVVIDFLARGPAKAVAYDVSLTDRDRRTGIRRRRHDVDGRRFRPGARRLDPGRRQRHPPGRRRLRRRHGRRRRGPDAAIGAAGRLRLDESVDLRPALSGPYPGLGEAARALGHNVMLVDEDGPVRQVIPFVRREGLFLPSFGIAAAQAMLDVPSAQIRLDGGDLVIGTTRLPAPVVDIPRFDGQAGSPQKGRRSLIRYRGPAILPDGKTPTYRTYSFYDLFYSEQQLLEGQKPLIDPATFKGGLVFIGATAVGLKDVFAVPLGATGAMAGPHIHANVADMVLSGRVIHRSADVAVRSPGAARFRWCKVRSHAGAGVAGRRRRRRPAGGRAPRRRAGLRAGPLGAAGTGHARLGARDRQRLRVPVPRRRPREAAGAGAVLALPVEGRLRAGARQSRRWRNSAASDARCRCCSPTCGASPRSRRAAIPRRSSSS